MNIKSNKLKTAVMASVLALSINLGITNTANAINYSKFDLNNKFLMEVSYGNPNSYTSNEDNDYSGYFFYSPEDMTIYGDADHWNGTKYPVGTLEGGKLYFIYRHAGVNSGHTGSSVQFYNDGILIYNDVGVNGFNNITELGDAADIFGEGISEDEIKDLISDAIHKVDGDQTVDGNQQVTGDQQVDGEQTVKWQPTSYWRPAS